MHSGADIEASSAALNRDIEGDNASTSQSPTSTNTATEEVNKPAGKQVTLDMLLPVIESQLDKDRAVQLQGLCARLTSNNINKEQFGWYLRRLVGDRMLMMTMYKLQQGQQVKEKLNTKPSGLPMDNPINQERDPFPIQGQLNHSPPIAQEKAKSDAKGAAGAGKTTEKVQPCISKEFIKGATVEVCNDEDGAWFSATILEQLTNSNFKIEYKSLRNDDDTALLTEEVDINHIRPCPPKEKIEHFRLFEEVDALYNDGWWVGVVSKVLSQQKYEVFLRGTNEELVLKQSDLRRHLEWINGKWLLSNSVCDLINKVEKPGNLSSPEICSKKRKVLDMMQDFKEKRKMKLASATSDTRLPGDQETEIEKPDNHSPPESPVMDDERRLQDLAHVAILDEQKPHEDNLKAELDKMAAERNEYVVLVNKMKRIINRHKAKKRKLTNKLNVSRKALKEKEKELKAVVNRLNQREVDICRLKEERRWLITQGIPRSFEVIRGSAEFRNVIAELAASADFVGRQDGMRDGIKLQRSGKRIEDHEYYKADAEGDLANSYQALSDVRFPVMEELVSTADHEDLDALKALLASPVHDGSE